jgi:hypothetical protein
MALLRLPYAFTQDALLGREEFVKAAERVGRRITPATLERLADKRLLEPFFVIDAQAGPSRKIDLPGEILGSNPRGYVMRAAIQGRLYDGALDAAPAERNVERVVYGSWQLDRLWAALRDEQLLDHGMPVLGDAAERRRVAVALHALSSLHLPSILLRASFPAGLTEEGFRASNAAIRAEARLELVGLAPESLRPTAEQMLFDAFDDPIISLWPLLRHGRRRAWSKLKGRPRECVWSRIGAEILLRAHEDLALAGRLDPIEDSPSTVRMPLHDRISATGQYIPSLDESLGSLGLSPHPKVLLLLEGQTEMLHVPRVLELFGLNEPSQVRVQNARGVTVNPSLLSRYAITPQLTEPGKPGLERHPTALVIAMDPEDRWATPASCAEQRSKIQAAIREEVADQGGAINDAELDHLVTVTTWPDGQRYELANFTVDSLTDAMFEMASSRRSNRLTRADIAAAVQVAHDAASDIGTAFEALRMKEDKPRLAGLLWPVLRERCERELSSDDGPISPVLDLVLAVRDKVALNSGGHYTLEP